MAMYYLLQFSEAILGSNKLPKVSASTDRLSTIMNSVFAIIGIVAVIFIIIGGLKYVLSNGNAQEAEKARHQIVYSVVGLVVSMMAFMIVQFVTSNAF